MTVFDECAILFNSANFFLCSYSYIYEVFALLFAILGYPRLAISRTIKLSAIDWGLKLLILVATLACLLGASNSNLLILTSGLVVLFPMACYELVMIFFGPSAADESLYKSDIEFLLFRILFNYATIYFRLVSTIFNLGLFIDRVITSWR